MEISNWAYHDITIEEIRSWFDHEYISSITDKFKFKPSIFNEPKKENVNNVDLFIKWS